MSIRLYSGVNITDRMLAYFGLYCAECPNHTGEIADLAGDLRKNCRPLDLQKQLNCSLSSLFLKCLKTMRYAIAYFGEWLNSNAVVLAETAMPTQPAELENALRKRNLTAAGSVMNSSSVRNLKRFDCQAQEQNFDRCKIHFSSII